MLPKSSAPCAQRKSNPSAPFMARLMLLGGADQLARASLVMQNWPHNKPCFFRRNSSILFCRKNNSSSQNQLSRGTRRIRRSFGWRKWCSGALALSCDQVLNHPSSVSTGVFITESLCISNLKCLKKLIRKFTESAYFIKFFVKWKSSISARICPGQDRFPVLNGCW